MNPTLQRRVGVDVGADVGPVNDQPHRTFGVVVGDDENHRAGKVGVIHQGVGHKQGS